MTVNTVTLKGNEIPKVLQQIPQPPKQLFVAGNLEPLLKRPRLAVIGSRRISPYGKSVTQSLTQAVAKQDVVIISGLALGADGVAHQAALDAGGQTIAVLPAGLDRIYPTSHYQLAQQILVHGGALVTEYPPRSEPYPVNFLARNRLVSGLSNGVLITEAAERSGTLATANFALEQGRTVMAVPGNTTSPLSVGTNNLIKTGAITVTEPADIFNALHLNVTTEINEVTAHNEAEHIILKLLQSGITDGAELQTRSGLTAANFNQTLTMLEITGRIQALGANHWRIR